MYFYFWIAFWHTTYRPATQGKVTQCLFVFEWIPACLCVNPSVAHTTEQLSPKQSADMSPGLPAPRPLTPMGVYIPAYTSSLQTIQWNPATLSSFFWVGQASWTNQQYSAVS